MLAINATDVRNEWSYVIDSVVREKPAFIKRTRDYMCLVDIKLLELLLAAYTFSACSFTEEDGSVTLALNEIDLLENGLNEAEAKNKLAKAIIDYAEDFYEDFPLWSAAPNRKPHIPYVFKALITNDIKKIEDMIQCQAGGI